MGEGGGDGNGVGGSGSNTLVGARDAEGADGLGLSPRRGEYVDGVRLGLSVGGGGV